MWTDTHAHLADETLFPILDQIIERATSRGVSRLVCVAVDAATSTMAKEIAEKYSSVWASVGIHPNYAHLATDRDWDTICQLASHPRVCALGETGLDLHWDDCPFAVQQSNFARHIALSRQTNLPLIIHMRDCESEMVDFLKSQSDGHPMGGVMHSFSGSSETGLECLKLGLYVSFAGMLTYKKSQPLRDTAKTIPIDRLLVETDCPYLSPEPHRSKRPNEPANVVYTGQCLAQTMDIPVTELAKHTTENALRLFWRMDR
ncbi:MAG: TatD family hydrolase [Pirellula sp.]